MPYTAVQQMTDPAHPWGIGYYAKADYLTELPNEAIDAMIDKVAKAASPYTGMHLVPLGGAFARADRSTMALEAPNVSWYYMCMALWMDPAQAEHETTWAREPMQTMRPWTLDKAPQLHQQRRGPRPAARLLRRREVRTARRAQRQIRPRQGLRTQPEHPAERGERVAVIRARPRSAAGSRGGRG